MRRLFVTLALLALLPCAVGLGALAALAVEAPVAPTVVAPESPEPMVAASRAFESGDALLAIGYLSQVPPGSRDYSRAQRWIGHRACTVALRRPEAGLRHSLRALRAEPLAPQGWRDAARTVVAVVRW